jgi:hypothetical protein
VTVKSAPADLDIAASRTGSRVFLHVLNKNYSRSAEAEFNVEGMRVLGGRVFEIAPDDPRTAVGLDQPKVFAPVEKPLAGSRWRFPPASVSAVDLELA